MMQTPNRLLNWLLPLMLFIVAAPSLAFFDFSMPGPGREEAPAGPYRYPPQRLAPGAPPGYQGTAPPWSGQAYPPNAPYQRQPYRQERAYPPNWGRQYTAPYTRSQRRERSSDVHLELELRDKKPYVQENVVLELRVVSERNLESAVPYPPTTSDALLKRLEDQPRLMTRAGQGGRREIINAFQYAFTPLRDGVIELPPFQVDYAFERDRTFEVESEALEVDVRPAMSAVNPWLPLRDLSLQVTLDGSDEVEPGQPVSLVLDLAAIGATGDQLPSLERWLDVEDIRVYRERTLIEGGLSEDARRIVGGRTEYYTLVPRFGGRLQLPEIRLPWWNVAIGRMEYAGMPIRTLDVAGARSGAIARDGGWPNWLWLLPVLGLILLLLGYWLGVWFKGRQPAASIGETFGQRISEALRAGSGRVSAGLKRLDPTPLLARMGPAVVASLPRSARLGLCLRAAQREREPAAWCDRFLAETRRHFPEESASAPPGLMPRLMRLYPGTDADALERSMLALDGALYGGQDIDFERWKRQLRRQLRRSKGSQIRTLRDRVCLPALNPG